MKYHLTKKDQEFLKSYNIEDFDRPSIATDIVVFAISADKELIDSPSTLENKRKNPEKKLRVLLIKRGESPFEGMWALPGGFCKKNEDVIDTAARELFEEAGVTNAYLTPCGIYGEVGRDPRGWIISHTFLSLVDSNECSVKSGSDAWEARWFEVNIDSKIVKRSVDENHAFVINEHRLTLTNTENETPIQLQALIRETRKFENYHEKLSYEEIENHNIAFDHGKNILITLLTLREKAESESKLIFDLMPATFTLFDLQKAFEIVLAKKLLTANFRRKTAEYVCPTDEIIEGLGHRPARLFKRNIASFYQKPNE